MTFPTNTLKQTVIITGDFQHIEEKAALHLEGNALTTDYHAVNGQMISGQKVDLDPDSNSIISSISKNTLGTNSQIPNQPTIATSSTSHTLPRLFGQEHQLTLIEEEKEGANNYSRTYKVTGDAIKGKCTYTETKSDGIVINGKRVPSDQLSPNLQKLYSALNQK